MVAHPLMLRAIAAAKKKNDHIDANKICDCLRCDFLPECYMASSWFGGSMRVPFASFATHKLIVRALSYSENRTRRRY